MTSQGSNTPSDQRDTKHHDNEGHQGGQYGGSKGADRGKPDEKSNVLPAPVESD